MVKRKSLSQVAIAVLTGCWLAAALSGCAGPQASGALSSADSTALGPKAGDGDLQMGKNTGNTGR
ncbi:MAG: hypothetical protein JO267_05815 [Alphaproteobacteria bacterium]|nr:hypothetical protein [Alphaproteobacteria bacterium]